MELCISLSECKEHLHFHRRASLCCVYQCVLLESQGGISSRERKGTLWLFLQEAKRWREMLPSANHTHTCVCINTCLQTQSFQLEKSLIRSYDFYSVLYSWVYIYIYIYTYMVAQMVKNLPAMWETQVWSLSQDEPLEKEMAAHSSILAWELPWAKEPGRLYHGVTKSWTQLRQ